MAEIILTTLNARYHHSAFGLRYLLANMGDLQPKAQMLEFGIKQLPIEVLSEILSHQPKIVAIGVYIWNIEQATKLVADLKRLRPEITVILGGPEVSYEFDAQPIVEMADFIITGEADLVFPQVCRQILEGTQPAQKVIPAPTPDLNEIKLPYDLYADEDIANRVIYVEASRGCPFQCEFCLSSLDIPTRQFQTERFLAAMQSLFDRGVRQFKFVDRTFNLNPKVGRAILQFFLDRYEPGLFLHFEMIPDHLPDSLRELIKQFPVGALQFEVGIQTFNQQVTDLISRKQNYQKLNDNLTFLREETGVHVHADLIVGLPGEDLDSFAAGFDQLVNLKPQEIQVGILKRLRGTPIVRHDDEWGMVYSPHAPYEILENRLINFETMQSLRRFARYWDMIFNSGNFVLSAPLIWQDESPFFEFNKFCNWLFQQQGRSHGIALTQLAELVFRYLTEQRGLPGEQVAPIFWNDYQRGGRTDRPHFLRPFQLASPQKKSTPAQSPSRQSRHAGL